MNFIIDNGHGGVKNGVYTTAPNYDKNNPKTWHKMWVHDGVPIFEGDFNRKVADRIMKLSIGKPYDTELLVPELEDISLEERVRRLKGKKGILLSIHGNAFNTSVKGFEIFTTKGQTKADGYAEIMAIEIHKSFPNQCMRWDLTDRDRDKEANFFILRKAEELGIPAILSENFFFDNKEDAEMMMSDAFLDKLAQTYITAFNKIYNDDKP